MMIACMNTTRKWSKAAADDLCRSRRLVHSKNAKRLARGTARNTILNGDGREYRRHHHEDHQGRPIVSIISGLFFGVLQPLLAPPTFTGDDGTVYMKSADGSFVEK